ncbi:MAG: TldD/PmbA family protein, partial [Candidatus Omnitrophica bacterium]|nr:TldD/PmbA family protein [Candidatus Omnitrophota bacterium]
MSDKKNPPHALLNGLMRYLKQKGVDYADVRYEHLQHENLLAEQGRLTALSSSESAGIGIRVLWHGSWGFAATPHLSRLSLQRQAAKAIGLAKASALLNRKPRPLSPIEPAVGQYASSFEIDPFEVPLSKKLDYLLWANTSLLGPDAIVRASTHMDFRKRRKLFFSTDGARIEQSLMESAAGLEVVAQLGSEVQTRSFPNSHHGALAQAGYEYVKQLDLVGGAKTVKEEVLQLLRAEPVKAAETTIILDPTQVVMQLHESCGHPTELDRALGQELSYAGGSFLTPDQLGKLQYGSRHVTIVADATLPSGVGSFGYDDEGVPAKRVELIREGRFVGYLSSRESAAQLNLSSSGAMRAELWNAPPLVRMTNVNLEPGTASLEELCSDIRQGYLLATNKSWSIDDRRLNFQFSTEIGWEIIDGKIGRIVKNPLYTGITPRFWNRCTGVAGPEYWKLWGVPNCAKGEPMQL